ncbi:MAG: UDP-3-O-acyl-N-acetylglucosamine deacetylase [bacterium]
MKKRTLKAPITLKGIGLHSGQQCSVTISPASEDNGITINGQKAIVEHVSKTKRGTTFGSIAVVEHLLAALSGLGIDNAAIQITGDEIPALDGSSQLIVKALKKTGIISQPTDKSYLSINAPIFVKDGQASLEALPYNGFKVDFMIKFPVVGEQKFSFDSQKDSFAKEIAPARTVGSIEEHEKLKSQGLALGASLENALVISQDGYINRPRFPDEIVRHKILDLIGDLALLGTPLQAHIKANKSGHKLNIELVRRLLKNG